MEYKRLTFKIRGVSPLVMHNGQLADPLNKHSKEMRKISGKRKKTEADFEQLAKLEWFGSLYLHGGAPCIPGEVLEAGFIEAARKNRRGQQAKAGIVSDGFWPIEFDGPKSPDQLWEDENYRLTVGVRIQKNRIMRTRPIFRAWSATVSLDYLTDQLDKGEVVETVEILGRIVGLGDWRPRFGRFEVVR
ncbi:MAG: hypothetical protein K2Y05_05825 [Hyphomicrobiaceae bacterium]|nr:hypothetical protein [Hyphomicrobiaceae bacterium]